MYKKIAIALIPLLALTACGAPSESDISQAFNTELARVPPPYTPKLIDLERIGCSSADDAYVCDVKTRVSNPMMGNELTSTGRLRLVKAGGEWVISGRL
ncbi:MAG TPA: hypothetical protein VMF58_07050 [Rhizomicrobium sp.]|nr:hypothetical protein [Rhizomicrobium sp.]